MTESVAGEGEDKEGAGAPIRRQKNCIKEKSKQSLRDETAAATAILQELKRTELARLTAPLNGLFWLGSLRLMK